MYRFFQLEACYDRGTEEANSGQSLYVWLTGLLNWGIAQHQPLYRLVLHYYTINRCILRLRHCSSGCAFVWSPPKHFQGWGTEHFKWGKSLRKMRCTPTVACVGDDDYFYYEYCMTILMLMILLLFCQLSNYSTYRWKETRVVLLAYIGAIEVCIAVWWRISVHFRKVNESTTQIISVTTRVGTSRRVHRFNLELRDRQAARITGQETRVLMLITWGWNTDEE